MSINQAISDFLRAPETSDEPDLLGHHEVEAEVVVVRDANSDAAAGSVDADV
jgi:hypothetical protein